MDKKKHNEKKTDIKHQSKTMEKKDLRIIFMGTPEFAVGTLSALVEGGYNVVAVVTQPDKPVGRHQDTLQPSQVKQYAISRGLPVLQPVKMKDSEFIQQLESYNADLQVVVAFRMLPELVWAMPRFGTFNVHAALLPQYRGAAPINWAVINGEKQTGVTTFFLDHDIDTGRIIMQKTFEIKDDFNVENVYDGLMNLGAQAAVETIDMIIEGNGEITSVAQETMIKAEETLHNAPKIFKETCEINWNTPSKKIYDFIRGLSPYPGAWSDMTLANGKKTVLKVFKTSKTQEPSTDKIPGTLKNKNGELFVSTTDCWLKIDELQLIGKKRINAHDFLNGFRDIECCTLG